MALLRPEGPLCGEFFEAHVLEPPTNEDSLFVRDARSELRVAKLYFTEQMQTSYTITNTGYELVTTVLFGLSNRSILTATVPVLRRLGWPSSGRRHTDVAG